MKQSRLILIAWTAIVVSAGPAAAGPCQDQIAQFETEIERSAGSSAGPTAPESIGAKLGRQPTPGSVRRAEASAQSRFAEVLARAKDFDARGDRAECMHALSEAKSIFDLE